MIVTVVASTAANSLPASVAACGAVPSRKRSRLPTTASASRGVPSVNSTSSRSVTVSTVLSSLYSQSVASQGSISPSPFFCSSVSNTAWKNGLRLPYSAP